MTAIGDILKMLLGNMTGITDNIVTIGLTVFAIALGVFSISHLNRRRRTLDQQRLAAIIKGLHYAGVSRDVFSKPKQDSQDHLLSGLRWLFGAAGLSGTLYAYQAMQPASVSSTVRGWLAGIIPAAIGLAHMLFSWICASRNQAAPTTASRLTYNVRRR